MTRQAAFGPLAVARVALVIGLVPALAGAIPAGAAEPPAAQPSAINDKAGAVPFDGQAMYRAFHGKAGIDRVVDRLVDLNVADPRISDIFQNQNLPRLKRLLAEQFCYLLNGPCRYTGRDMKAVHKNMGVRASDFNALIENLQRAMDEEKVPFAAQNRLLAKLAPMERMIVER